MTNKPVIQRYLSTEHLNRAIQDMKPVIKLLNSSYGEFSLQLREDYFNIYYQGNSAAKVQFNAGGTYSAIIHYKFVEEILESLNKYSDIKQTLENRNSNGYCRFKIQPKNLHGFFQRAHLQRLSGKIRKVHNGEEITMEQVIVTDNPPNRNFIIIDRQVADHENFARVDLLGLKRDSNNKYHFVAIELKLGRNPELKEAAGAQVSGYIEHIREHIAAYSECYEINYSQKKKLGLFDEELPRLLPDSIEINKDMGSVKGIVISSGYSRLAKDSIKSLEDAIKNNGWHIRAHQMQPMNLEHTVD